MGMLERWDRHNQAVMDLARPGDVAGWTVGAVLFAAFDLLYIVGRLPRPVAVDATALIAIAAIVGVVRSPAPVWVTITNCPVAANRTPRAVWRLSSVSISGAARA